MISQSPAAQGAKNGNRSRLASCLTMVAEVKAGRPSGARVNGSGRGTDQRVAGCGCCRVGMNRTVHVLEGYFFCCRLERVKVGNQRCRTPFVDGVVVGLEGSGCFGVRVGFAFAAALLPQVFSSLREFTRVASGFLPSRSTVRLCFDRCLSSDGSVRGCRRGCDAKVRMSPASG